MALGKDKRNKDLSCSACTMRAIPEEYADRRDNTLWHDKSFYVRHLTPQTSDNTTNCDPRLIEKVYRGRFTDFAARNNLPLTRPNQGYARELFMATKTSPKANSRC
jgi:hypothetical protein